MIEERKIEQIRNVLYEPENNGIETLWGTLKFKFRKELTDSKLKRETFNTLDVLNRIINQTCRVNMIRKHAMHGWRAALRDSRSPRKVVTNFQGKKVDV